jgi:ParB family transcriptional regulator, chromosome partitioning protein
MGEVTEGLYEKGHLYDINLTDLQADTEQPRKYFDELALAELKSSIETHGVLQPILVRQGPDGGLLIVSGERRYQASKLAGCQTIPAVFTTGEPVEIAIIENLMRENLTAIEEAEAIERLRTLHDYTLAALGTALGKSKTTISEILSLNNLPESVKDDCRNDPKTSRSILVAIASHKTQTVMTNLYTKYKESGLTRGEIRARVTHPKPADAPIDLSFTTIFQKRISTLDITKLSNEQMESLRIYFAELVKLIDEKVKLMQ